MNNSMRIDKISWQHHEHPHIEKTSDWFWSVGIVAVGAIILALFFKHYLSVLIVVFFTFISFALAKRKPSLLRFEISRRGVRAGNTLYPFSMLESFWVEDTEFKDSIFFKSKKPFSPIIILPFDSSETDPELIRDFLLDYLDEEELQEPLYQIILERLGF